MTEHPVPRDPTERPSLVRRLVVLFVVAAALVLVDQVSKQWALGRLSEARRGHVSAPCTVEHSLSRARRDPVILVPGHVSFEYTENCGGAFGLLGKTNERIRYPFFVGISILAVLVILQVYRKLEPHQALLRWALPLVLGGALGNFYDRLVYRYVIDFIKVQLDERLVWPTFNVADAAITVGVALMILDMFPRRGAARTQPASAAPATAVPSPARADDAGAGEASLSPVEREGPASPSE